MAILLVDEITDEEFINVFEPVIISGTTSRYPFSAAGVRLTTAISSYDDNGGKLRVAATSAAGFEVGDTIEISGATGLKAIYNGLHEIQGVVSNAITLTTTYAAAATGDAGSCSRRNDDLHLIVEFPGAETLIVPVTASSTDYIANFYFDYRKTLQSLLSLNFTLTPGVEVTSVMDVNGSADPVTITERFRDKDNAYKDGSDDDTQVNWIAHNCTDFAGIWQLYNNSVMVGAILHVRGYYEGISSATDYQVILSKSTDGVSFTADTTLDIDTDNFYMVFTVPDTNYIRLTLKALPATIVDTFDIPVLPVCDRRKTLYYKNRMGGFSTAVFQDYEEVRTAQKVEKWVTKTEVIQTLIAYPASFSELAAYADIVTSAEVYNDAGTQVEVITKSAAQWVEWEEVEIELKFEECGAI